MNSFEPELQRLRNELDAASARIGLLEEELARERGARYALFEATPDLIAIKDNHSVYRMVNPAFCRFLGKKEEEIVGRPDNDLFPPDEAELCITGDAKVMRTRQPEVVDRQISGMSGKVWVQLLKIPVLDREGQPSGICCLIRDIGARKRAEMELERFFDLIPDMVCIASLDGFIIKVNAAWERYLGYSQEELTDMPFMDVIHPEDREIAEREYERQKGGSEVRNLLLRHRAKDGSYHWLEWNSFLFAGNTLYAAARDVTARIENEKETRLWADAFRFCAHGIAIGLPLTNSVLTCNEAFARMRGVPISDIEGAPIVNMYAPEDREMVIDRIREADRSGSVTYEARLIRKDGRTIPVQMDVVSISDPDGQMLYRIATMQDITERQNSQMALLESEQRFRSAVESAPEGIFIQTKGCFSYLNPTALEMFGATATSQLIGRRVIEYTHPEFRKIVSERIRGLNKELRSMPLKEERMLRIDGTPFDAEVSAVPFVYSGAHGALVFMRDVTSRKKADLERVGLEKQLFQSQKIESIGRLAGGVAHDLNNLLTPILGYSEWLSLGFPADDKRRQHLNIMHEAALKARDLVRQLLAFSSSQSLEFRSVDLNAIVNGFEHLLRRTLRANIEISCLFHEGILPMLGDAGQLEQIIMNLAINADDSMPDGGHLTIQTADETVDATQDLVSKEIPAGRYVVLSVQDEGSGMDPETLAHVFEPFFTTKPKGKGTGLGLSTVYGIVRQHGGFIRVSSEPGAGSCFRIYFPKHDGDVLSAPQQPSSIQDEKRDGTILVVEDDDMVRQFVIQTLMQEGYEVFEASGGEPAMDLLARKACVPDLLLTDLVMKGMNGKELHDRVKKLVPGLKVVYMSGYTRNIITSHGILNEGISFLQKPFTVQALLAKVSEVMSAQAK
jgi:two-component system, cell cycle sensor histidine kinase and response regulator CckA